MTYECLTLRSYPLPELKELIKPMYAHIHNWRLNEGKIEFSLSCTGGEEWFPLFQAPLHVEKFVRAWVSSGGLNEVKHD